MNTNKKLFFFFLIYSEHFNVCIWGVKLNFLSLCSLFIISQVAFLSLYPHQLDFFGQKALTIN